MASHLVSLWKWDFLELGNGLCIQLSCHRRFQLTFSSFQIFHFHWSIPSRAFFFIWNVYTDFLLKIHEFSQFLSTCPKSATTTNAAQRTTNLIQRWLENRFSSKIAASIPLSASKSGSKDQDNVFLCQLMSVKNPFKECKVKSPQLYFFQQPHKTLLTSGDPQYVKLSFTEIPPNLTVNGEYK